MEDKKIINRTITLILSLDATAKEFGYNLEVDSQEDVYHNGYSNKDVRKMDLRLPEDLTDSNKIFPSAVGSAMEDAERDSYSAAIRKERISALTRALENIDLTSGGAEYQDMDGKMVSAKAGILSAVANEKDDTLTVEILNPEHLINTVISGMGYFASDLSSTEPATEQEIKQKFHNLNDFFGVYGASKPKGEISSQFSPDTDDDSFSEEIKFRISEMDISKVADCVVEAVEYSNMAPKEAIDLASKLSSHSVDAIKAEILKGVKEQEDLWKNL